MRAQLSRGQVGSPLHHPLGAAGRNPNEVEEVTIPKRTKRVVSQVAIANAKQDALRAAVFMMLGDCEGVCQVGTSLPDRRKHCHREDTVLVMVFLGDGTREGELSTIGRVCMKHLPDVIANIKQEAPGGNGPAFKTPVLPGTAR